MKRILTGIAIAACMAMLASQLLTAGQPVAILHKGSLIVVDENAVPAHLAHGDSLVGCVSACVG